MAAGVVVLSLLLVVFSDHLVGAFGRQKEFDYFALALQWPATYCRRSHRCCSSNGCCGDTSITEFTIHGLWPNYNDGGYPSCCDGPKFDEDKISHLKPLLEKYWPSLSCSSPSLCHGHGKGTFWEHEWEKHGTCTYPVIKDEYGFFSTTLDLYFKYNITSILDGSGFSASNAEKYSLGDIATAIKNAVGAFPVFTCNKGSLEELHICFSKSLKPQECTTSRSYNSNKLGSSCPQYISLPNFASFLVSDDDGNTDNESAVVGTTLLSIGEAEVVFVA